MADYFNSGDQNENPGGAAANTNGDAAMDDEISVSLSITFTDSLELTVPSDYSHNK
jgi:hypothetical protein